MSVEENALRARLQQARQEMPLAAGGDSPMASQQPRPSRVFANIRQAAIWLASRRRGGAALYNLPMAWRVSGGLDVEVLEEALNAVLARHEALRTNFVPVDGRPMQVVREGRRVRLGVADLRGATGLEDAVLQAARHESERPFDLEHDILVRCQVLMAGEHEHVVVLVVHHIVTDGWSAGILLEELTEAYSARAAGREPDWAPLPLQYADFAQWQREWLAGPRAAEQVEFWRQELAGAPELLELPTDHPRPGRHGFRGATVEFEVPAELTARLEAFNREQGVTMFMTLLAGFGAVLYRYTGQQDIVIGCPTANRTHLELDRLIGYVANVVMVRLRPAADMTFAGLLGQARHGALRAMAHQEVPFERIVEELRPPRHPDRNPLFQVSFQLQHAGSGLHLAGLDVTSLTLTENISQFELSLDMIHPPGKTLTGSFLFKTDLYHLHDIQALAERLIICLDSVTQQSTGILSSIPIISQDEEEAFRSWSVPAGKRQVQPTPKMRGDRVAPREVEIALERHPAVRGALVQASDTGSADTVLEAFIEPESAVTRGLIAAAQPTTDTSFKGGVFVGGQQGENAYLFNEVIVQNKYLRRFTLPESPCVVDVGCHIGIFSIYVGLSYPGATCIGVEPLDELARAAELNAAIYGVPFSVEKVAVGPAFEDVTIKLPSNQLREASRPTVSVPLSYIYSRRLPARSVDLLKINVPGRASAVLRGLRQEDFRRTARIVIDADNSEDTEICRQMIQDRGFTTATEPIAGGHVMLLASRAELQDGDDIVHNAIEADQLERNDPRELLRSLQEHVTASLPDYRLPSSWVLVPDIPRAPNGEPDLHALSRWRDAHSHDSLVATVSSRDYVDLVAEIYQSILGMAQLPGADDNFFSLGGNSLQTAQVVARLRSETGIEVPIEVLYEEGSPRRVAGAVAELMTDPAAQRADGPLDHLIRQRGEGSA